jgi:hypothetical protein
MAGMEGTYTLVENCPIVATAARCRTTGERAWKQSRGDLAWHRLAFLPSSSQQVQVSHAATTWLVGHRPVC